MTEYLYLLHPYRHGFFEQPTPEEAAIMEEHFAYLQQAAAAGHLLLAGPCLDDTFELVVFRAENDKAANAFMFADPPVRENVMAAELHPLRVSQWGRGAE